MDAGAYGDRIADDYDRWYPTVSDSMIETLAELAGDGVALELGIGTGRVALPLAARGVTVRGVDASEKMVAKLRDKPGGADIDVTIGDFADLGCVDGDSFSLVYCPFNTFFALLSQDEQIACLASAAAKLRPGGCVVLEAFVPDLARFSGNQTWRVLDVETDGVTVEASIHDPVNQRVTAKHIFVTEAGLRMVPIEIRYAWPSELDLMARLAGLTRRHRWATWDKRPFAPTSPGHVSVYELTADS